mgnify:CR=1 FL=1
MSHLGQPMPFYLASWGLSQTILGNFGPAHAALSGSLGSICNHVGPSWGSPCRCIWLVGVQLEPFLTSLGQPVPLYLACWCTSWPILRASWAVLDSSWAISGDLGRISGLLVVYLGLFLSDRAVLSGLLGSILAHLGQPMPLYLVCWGPSWPMLASPCHFIWLVGVHLGQSWPARAVSSGLFGSILEPSRASPCRFSWFLGVHLELFWGGPCRFICLLGVHLGPFQTILGQPLPP